MNQVLNEKEKGINRISVKGFKSLVNESSIELRPLTILAGTNSSGKSSIMQPILLMKQTLASSFNPGALLLNGSHVRFTSVEQMLSRLGKNLRSDRFEVELSIADEVCRLHYQVKRFKSGLKIERMEIRKRVSSEDTFVATVKDGMSKEAVREILDNYFEWPFEGEYSWDVLKDFCFLTLNIHWGTVGYIVLSQNQLKDEINRLIHLPGLRGNPERTYTTTDVEYLHKNCRGTFEAYTASIISHWQESGETPKLVTLGEHLKLLGLTDRVKTKQINDTEVEVFVSRMMGSSDEEDWVSIADVGLGVSQTLPVAVALLFAEPGQIVYIEQPEIHLHPRAQYDLAKLLAQAAARGVKVVIETHSSLLLRGIQTLVAADELDQDLVALHWFTRNQQGETVINSAEMDEIGAFGDWPEDFAEVELAAEMRYLDAVENKEMDAGEEEQ